MTKPCGLVAAEEVRQLLVELERVGNRLSLRACPHPEDVGRMVGSRSAMHHALMLLLTVAASWRGLGMHYRDVQDGGEDRRCERGAPYRANSKWPEADVLRRSGSVRRLWSRVPGAGLRAHLWRRREQGRCDAR